MNCCSHAFQLDEIGEGLKMVNWKKVRKGAAPIMIALVAVIAFTSLDIFDKDNITKMTANTVLDERSAYTALHTGEIFERTIESSVRFAVRKNLYELGDGGFNWTSTSPSRSELEGVLKERILNDLDFSDFEIDNASVEVGNVSFDIQYEINEVGIDVSGQIPFSVSYREPNFLVSLESYGNFSEFFETRYFRMVSIVQENLKCPAQVSEERLDESGQERYLLSVTETAGSIYQVSVTDLLDVNNIDGKNLQISVELDCN